MPKVTIIYGEEEVIVEAPMGSVVGDVIATTGLPLEQPCAGRGTCGKCKIIAELGLADPDEIERKHLTPGELAVGNRLACRARIVDDTHIMLAPIVVYSNKIFRSSHRYKKGDIPLGLAIDLGSTTVAAFLTMMDNGEVCAGSASLNQQTVFGADIISRLAAARNSEVNAKRLQKLAIASINQAIDSLKLSDRIKDRIQTVTIVGNVAMHHLLTGLSIDTLAEKPFQPYQKGAIRGANYLLKGVVPEHAQVNLPPMIGGFVGSDALACLAYFGFKDAKAPMAAIDLGTNGEVLVTDGKRILTASTAAGPAFEGVLISCGSRAVDGAIIATRLEQNQLVFDTLADKPPVGLTGSGLLSLINLLRQQGVIEPNGRISKSPPIFEDKIRENHQGRSISLLEQDGMTLTQMDIRELQKAKGAIRAAIETLMDILDLKDSDLQKVILTGSFGGQIEISAAIELGMIPDVPPERVEAIANGAGFGAAMFLAEEGFALGEEIAHNAEQIDLDQDTGFINRYIAAMRLTPEMALR